MPKWAARIWLEITDVKVERLHQIGEEAARAEGVESLGGDQFGDDKLWMTYRDIFIHLWDSINEKRGFGWDSNPYVWVVEFKVIDK